MVPPTHALGPQWIRSELIDIVAAFVVERDVEALFFFLAGYTDPDCGIYDHQNYVGQYTAVHKRCDDAYRLKPDLLTDSILESRASEGGIREHACENRTHKTTDAVDTEHVQGIVVAQPRFKHGYAKITAQTGCESDPDCMRFRKKPGS